MPSVTLIKSVVHDGDKYSAGEVLHGLTDKQAERLIRLKAASAGETVTIMPAENGSGDAPAMGLTPEKADAIEKMRRKAEVIAALKDAGIEAADSEKLADLKAMLAAAWTEPVGMLSAEEEEELALMSREELLLQLPDVGVQVTGQETEEELRAKLKVAWSADRKADD